jgi:hypothetical protein
VGRGDWPHRFAELASFLYTPARWARARSVAWTDELEQLQQQFLKGIYRATEAQRLSDGSAAARAPRLSSPLSPQVSGHLARSARVLAAQGMRFIISGGIVVARGPGVEKAERVLSEIAYRSPMLVEPMRTLCQQQEDATSGHWQWKVCRLCGRAFPAIRKAKACPPCRRRLYRRQVEWSLRSAPVIPVVILPLGLSGQRGVWLWIDKRVRAKAPRSLLLAAGSRK